MRELFKRTGVEHCVTAAYNPRANGQVERFNQTFCNILRKICENNKNNWPKMLKYVAFCYNTRVNSTGFCPFELVFGRKPNFFSRIEQESLSDSAILIQRSNEIFNLFENSQPLALKNISEQKEKQRKIQNDRENIQKQKLSIGTMVLIKNEGLLNKLDPKYKGPFIIHAFSKHGNYILKDSTGEIINNSFPLQKLKVIPYDEEKLNSLEIKKILNHRVKNNKYEYLVEFKNTSHPNEWIKEQNFNTFEIVNNYKNNLNKKKIHNMNTRNSTIKTNYLLLTIFHYFLLSCFFLKLFALKVNIPYCFENEIKRPINIENVCNSNFKSISQYEISNLNNFLNNDTLIYFEMLSKAENLVSGEAIHCRKIRTHFFYTENVLWDKTSMSETRVVPLTNMNCIYMYTAKDCEMEQTSNVKKHLNCSNNHCKYHEIPTPKYEWWKTNEVITDHCEIYKRFIRAETENDYVFNTNCKVKELQCQMDDGIMIWDRTAIKNCPLYTVGSGPFIKQGIWFINEASRLAFQFKSFETICNKTYILTEEGISEVLLQL